MFFALVVSNLNNIKQLFLLPFHMRLNANPLSSKWPFVTSAADWDFCVSEGWVFDGGGLKERILDQEFFYFCFVLNGSPRIQVSSAMMSLVDRSHESFCEKSQVAKVTELAAGFSVVCWLLGDDLTKEMINSKNQDREKKGERKRYLRSFLTKWMNNHHKCPEEAELSNSDLMMIELETIKRSKSDDVRLVVQDSVEWLDISFTCHRLEYCKSRSSSGDHGAVMIPTIGATRAFCTYLLHTVPTIHISLDVFSFFNFLNWFNCGLGRWIVFFLSRFEVSPVILMSDSVAAVPLLGPGFSENECTLFAWSIFRMLKIYANLPNVKNCFIYTPQFSLLFPLFFIQVGSPLLFHLFSNHSATHILVIRFGFSYFLLHFYLFPNMLLFMNQVRSPLCHPISVVLVLTRLVAPYKRVFSPFLKRLVATSKSFQYSKLSLIWYLTTGFQERIFIVEAAATGFGGDRVTIFQLNCFPHRGLEKTLPQKLDFQIPGPSRHQFWESALQIMCPVWELVYQLPHFCFKIPYITMVSSTNSPKTLGNFKIPPKK
ncbi:hypothetical protein VP01_199g6 [Puccinia sorghi]|uniref:Uncharacterized protein n=1 Tax=Puccinia sorghi TaxID=27349 RepID=A0A0L6VBK6_9BASI|nr:hypothetical protein VP01_199g6 [Puccinia sorghi]